MYEKAETDLQGEKARQAVMDALNDVGLYVGMRVEGTVIVTADGKVVSPRHSQLLRNHSPDGFEWGYCGSGPAQLALAILLREGLPDDLAVKLYQQFKRRYVSSWDREANWFLFGTTLRQWVHVKLLELQAKQAKARREEGDSA